MFYALEISIAWNKKYFPNHWQLDNLILMCFITKLSEQVYLLLNSKFQAPKPTLKPKLKFNQDHQAALLHKAVKGAGTDEKLLIDVLSSMTSDQRQKVVKPLNDHLLTLVFKSLHSKTQHIG